MGNKILSQAEVDALLRGVNEGRVDTRPAGAAPEGIHPFDLASRETMLRGRMPALEIINDEFARLLGTALAAVLRKPTACAVGATAALAFGEFVKSQPLPTSMHVLKIEPLRGQALLVMDASLIYLLLDFHFGGHGQAPPANEARVFTPIEQRFIQKIVALILEALQQGWQPVFPIRATVVRSETHPEFAQVAPAAETVVAITFRLAIESEQRDLVLCLPYPMLEPIRDRLTNAARSDQAPADHNWTDRLRAQLVDSTVNVTAEVGRTELTIREASQLLVGDVIVLDRHCEDPLDLLVENRPKFRGRPGTHRGNLAFQITTVIRQPKE